MGYAFYCVLVICVCVVVHRVIQFFENFWIRQHEYEKIQLEFEREQLRHEQQQMEHERWRYHVHSQNPEAPKGVRNPHEINESDEN